MAESKTESRDDAPADRQASSRAVAAAALRPRPSARTGVDPSSEPVAQAGASSLASPPAGLARGWVVVAPGGVSPAALGALAALAGALRPSRRLVLQPASVAAPEGPHRAAGAALGQQEQSSGMSSDSQGSGGGDAPDQADPQPLLAALAQEPGPWLWPLALDPGAWLGDRGSWAEALGAWRQPTLLLIPAAAAASGGAAAYAALLKVHGVPLLGLIQWGDPWLAGDRRRDGLPWLGWLAAPQEQAGPGPEFQTAASPGPEPLGPGPQSWSEPDPEAACEAAAALALALQLASQSLDLD